MYIEPNIYQIFGLTNRNGIITYSSQLTIQIHCQISNITRVIGKCGPELRTSNIEFAI